MTIRTAGARGATGRQSSMTHLRTRRRVIAGMAACLAVGAASATPGLGVINNPPANNITTDMSTEFVSAFGNYTAGEPLTMQVVRGRFVVGQASAPARLNAPAEMGIQVNHPVDGFQTTCWVGAIPDMLPGDEVRVLWADGNGDAMTVMDLAVTGRQAVAPDTVTLAGFARTPDGSTPLQLAAVSGGGGVEADIRSAPQAGPFIINGDNLITAPGDGNIALGTGLGGWTASWTLPAQADFDSASEGDATVSYIGDTLTDITSASIGAGVVPGPDISCSSVSTLPFGTAPQPDLVTPSDTGASGTDDLTTDTTPTFEGATGRVMGGSTVRLVVDDVVVATGTTSADKTYSFTAPALADGLHQIQVQETRLGIPRLSQPLAITIDTAPPGAPNLRLTFPASSSNHNAPRIWGSAEAGSRVNVFSGPSCAGAPVGVGTAAELGGAGIPVPVADNTESLFSANAADALGNTSACSNAISYKEVTEGRLAITGKALHQVGAGWRVRLALACRGPQGATCFGRLKMTARVSGRALRAAGARAAFKGTRTLVIGTKNYAVRAGKRTTVLVTISPNVRRLLKARGAIAARVEYQTTIGNGTRTVGARSLVLGAPLA